MTASWDESKALLAALKSGERSALSRLLTLAESTRSEHRTLVDAVLAGCPESAAPRIAITGAPGVGKSTLLETLGLHLVEQGLKVAVFTIDPTSPISGGSLLGDKTRMQNLSAHPLAFIRPAPSGKAAGGVSAETERCLHLFGAAGFDVIFLETVGVGQGEVEAWALVDCLLVLLAPAAGDELQGMKRGLMEHADCLAVTKADLDAPLAEQTRLAYAGALGVLRGRSSPPVTLVDGLSGRGVPELWQQLKGLGTSAETQERRDAARRARSEALFWRSLSEGVKRIVLQRAQEHPDGAMARVLTERGVGAVSPPEAAEEILRLLLADGVEPDSE